MDELHVIAGLPRAGSTLLCNLLNQNPDLHASSTSALAATVNAAANLWSRSAEIKSDLAHDREATEERLVRALRGLVEGWYADRSEPVIFDKGRGWLQLVDRFRLLSPRGVVFACVRDPRDVFASIQRHHLRYPVLDEAPGATLATRAHKLFSADGVVGGPLVHLEDHLSRGTSEVVPVVFERLVKDPERELRKVYAEAKLDWWSGHDFESVQNQATDLDALYLHKWPHDGSGKVQPPASRWQDQLPAVFGQQILQRCPTLAQRFGYG